VDKKIIILLCAICFGLGLVTGINVGIARGKPYIANKTCVIKSMGVFHQFDCTVFNNFAYQE
jgi:hypothetical protein